MRELTCAIRPSARGWVLTVGARRSWFPDKEAALRAAIAEARRLRAAGFFTSVEVQPGGGEAG